MGIASTIIYPTLVNISSSFLLGIYKSFNKNRKSTAIKKDISRFIDKYVDTDLDSGCFYEFIGSKELLRDFKEYINCSVYKKKSIEKPEQTYYLTKDTFISHLVDKAYNHILINAQKTVNKVEIRQYFNEVFNLLENHLIEKIEIDDLARLYFINSSIAEAEQRIIESLSKQSVTIHNNDNELIFNRYLKIIKSKFRYSHVYGLDNLDINSFYVFPTFVLNRTSEEIYEINEKKARMSIKLPVDWKDIFNDSHIISIVGGPGFGKTLFMSNLINRYHELNIINASDMLPIYCDLKQFIINRNKKTSYSIEEFLIDSMISNTGMDSNLLSKQFLSYYLEAGRCLILFDALDEVETYERNNLNETICNFFEVVNKYNKIVITSRSLGFTPKTRIVLNVHSVDTSQIREYLDKMVKLKQFNAKNVEEFTKQCKILIDSKFLTSLLTVSLLVQIYKAERELPENKIDLYDKCVEYISKKREKEQKKSSFNFTLMSEILDNNISFEKLAFLCSPNNTEIQEKTILTEFTSYFKSSYVSTNETKNAIYEFLNFCSQRTELFVAGNKEAHFRFYHRSFFEYYISKYLINEYIDNEQLIDELLKFGIDSEVFELTVSVLKKNNYTRYKILTELVFNKFTHICAKVSSIKSRQEELAKYGFMLKYSNRSLYDEKIFKIFFNKRRLINSLSLGVWGGILNEIFFRHAEAKKININVHFEKYYKEEMVALSLFDHFDDENIDFMIRDIKLNIGFHYFYAEKTNKYFTKFYSEYSEQQLFDLIFKHYDIKAKEGFDDYKSEVLKFVQKVR